MGRAVRWWRLSSAGAVVSALLVGGLLARTGARPEAPPAGPAPAPGCASSVPYVAGVGGYAAYRIPAVVRTRAGALLAFAEGRRDGTGDSGAVDIVVRRSADGGCGWDPVRVVAAGRGDTRGNPAPVVDPSTGDVVLVSSYNDGAVTEAQILAGRAGPDRGRRVFVQRSRDDGRSFTAPREITSAVTRPGWRWYATGPGHALALTRGARAGRLLVPANHSVAPPAGSPDTGREPRYYGAHALYSDDGGRSWSVGYVDDDHDGFVNANESSTVQLDDGRLYFTARDQHGTSPGNRAAAVSSDGGASLDRPYAPQPALAAMPVVQGSVLHLGHRRGDDAGSRGDVLLFSGPSVPDVRARMAIWRSTDGGRSATRVLTLSPRPAAYSDLVRADAETVGLLYETGTRHPYESIAFRRVPLDVVTQEVPRKGATPENVHR
ncbi:exo-alpha-sialidase [Streptomyces sp. NPDC058745]|uniref:sialidase family protein n=1 Tax=Streptomyces sp. NPDC058745 TaxID=3346621 RepID=UPI00369AAED0